MGALSDGKVGELINLHFVASYQQVGRFVTQSSAHAPMRWGGKMREPRLQKPMLTKLGGNVVSYFCTPEGEVLFYLVGPAEAETLLAAGQWAEKTYERLKQASVGAAQGRALVREAHLKCSHPASRAAFAAYPSRWQAGKAPPPGLPTDLGALFTAAAKAREAGQKAFVTAKLREAYPDNEQLVAEAGTWGRAPLRDPEAQRQREQAHRLYYEAVLAYHKDFAAQSAHLVLAEIPLVKLSDVQQEIFQRQAGQLFQQRTERNDDLLAAVKELRQRKQPLLMLVARGASHRYSSEGEFHIPRRSLSMLKSKPVAELLGDFELLELSSLELTTLRDDLDEEPLRVNGGYMASFVVLDGAGRVVAAFGENALPDQLAGALRRALPEDAAQRTADKEPETVAARELRLAAQLLEKSPVAAQRRLRSLVASHPRTAAAQRAQELLSHRD